MSTPLDQQPPPAAVTRQSYTSGSGQGSVGPVIAVLAVIVILGIIAAMIGRLCSGRRILGHGEYDLEGWLERKCSSCVDGHVDPYPTRRRPGGSVGELPVAAAGPVDETPVEETRQEQAQEKPLRS